jgi:uncharacterized protein
MRQTFLLLLICSWFITHGQTYTVETVPNTKLVDNSYVSNPDGILTESTVSEINSILGALEAQTTAQVAVVAIQSIGDADIFDFAQELFNTWGIGQKDKDNGLLVLLVLDKRTIRHHTGYGVEGDLPDIVCKHIETRLMVPRFKEGDYDGGILAGVQEVARILGSVDYGDSVRYELNTTDTSGYEDQSDDSPADITGFLGWTAGIWSAIMIIVFFYNRSHGLFKDSPKFKPVDGPNIKTGSFHFLFWFLIVPVGIMVGMIFVNNLLIFLGAFYAYLFMGAAETRVRLNSAYTEWYPKKEYHRLHQLYQEKHSFWKMVAFVIPIPFAFLLKPYKKRMQFLREHPRDCAQCNQPCIKLDDKTEDPFLNKQQLFEEGLRSVDYDVWKCQACSAAQVFRYPTPGTQYEGCPKCSTVAYYLASTRTIKAATTSSEGLREEVRSCKYCKHRDVKTITIPRKSESSSGGGGGSSGGSWGGGSSGGGGSSSSW